jgi:hypothetical protein
MAMQERRMHALDRPHDRMMDAGHRSHHRTETAGMSHRSSGAQLRRHHQHGGDRRGADGRACSTEHHSTPRNAGRIRRDISAGAPALASVPAGWNRASRENG